MVKIVIADDHPLVIEGLKKVLRRGELDIEIIGQASNVDMLFSILEKELPDLVILDIAMPGTSGLDGLKELRQEFPDLSVLMLSMHPEDRFAVRTLKAGASGYLTKDSVPEELERAIRTIVKEKRKYISPAVAEQLAEQVDTNSKKPLHTALSDREYQVLCMIASGKEVNEIADELSLSARTVHTYRSRLMTKMNLDSNVEITRYALSHELVDEP